MTLTGTYSRNLDNKYRIAIPKQLRRQFSSEELVGLYVAPGTEQSLAVYSPAAFQRLAERLENRSNRSEVRDYLRFFYAQAEHVEFDAQGRIRIPERLVAHAQLRHDVVLLGVQNHAEIWDQEIWNHYLTQRMSQFDDLAGKAFED
ncbi:MAG: division/cell wall cluster transcriptional repressor MraZ [Planctomycetaceae bacterium]